MLMLRMFFIATKRGVGTYQNKEVTTMRPCFPDEDRSGIELILEILMIPVLLAGICVMSSALFIHRYALHFVALVMVLGLVYVWGWLI